MQILHLSGRTVCKLCVTDEGLAVRSSLTRHLTTRKHTHTHAYGNARGIEAMEFI